MGDFRLLLHGHDDFLLHTHTCHSNVLVSEILVGEINIDGNVWSE